MSKAQLVITAVVLEGRSKSEVARDYEVSCYWVHQLVTRYEAEGAAAFTPRSRRPRTNPRATTPELEETIIRLRKTLRQRDPASRHQHFNNGDHALLIVTGRSEEFRGIPPRGWTNTSWCRTPVYGCGRRATTAPAQRKNARSTAR